MNKLFVFFSLFLFAACCDPKTDLTITDQQAGRLGLISAIGLRENAKIKGTLHNGSTSCTYRNITLKIDYLGPDKASVGTEILPLEIALQPGAFERFEVKTQNAPKGWEGDYQLSIEQASSSN